MLDALDDWADRAGLDGAVGSVERFMPTEVAGAPRLGLVLGREIRSVVWATGFRPDFRWLKLPVFDRDGALRHDRGVVDAPGLYVLGLPYLRRRKSSFIHGTEDDVRELGAHIAAHLERSARARPVPLPA